MLNVSLDGKMATVGVPEYPVTGRGALIASLHYNQAMKLTVKCSEGDCDSLVGDYNMISEDGTVIAPSSSSLDWEGSTARSAKLQLMLEISEWLVDNSFTFSSCYTVRHVHGKLTCSPIPFAGMTAQGIQRSASNSPLIW